MILVDKNAERVAQMLAKSIHKQSQALHRVAHRRYVIVTETMNKWQLMEFGDRVEEIKEELEVQ